VPRKPPGRTPEIRPSTPDDHSALASLYPAVFPNEDLVPLVDALLRIGDEVVSLVTSHSSSVTGHLVMTPCAVDPAGGRAGLLGPLAVAPDWQGRGLGTALVREGLARMESVGAWRVCVLGDPGYYGRFGFSPESRLLPPYPLPEEWRDAWQSIALGGADSRLTGQLVVPEPWRRPELWGP